MAEDSGIIQQKINLVAVLKRTVETVLDRCGIEHNLATSRLVASILLNLSAHYLREVDEPPQSALDLLTAFLTGDEEAQKLALQKYGEAASAPRIEPNAEGGEA
jgi:hypothetical protein